MREWTYENEQWTKLPAHIRHLPLFTQHFDLTSRIVRFVWSIILKNWFYTFYIRLEVKGGDFSELYAKYKSYDIIIIFLSKIIISNKYSIRIKLVSNTYQY